MANENRVPFFIPVTAIVLVALMFCYSAFLDPSFPDKTLKNFYQSYMAQDYTDAASSLSVILAGNTAEFANNSSAEMMEMRDAVNEVLAANLSAAALYADSFEGVSIQILPSNVLKGANTALVPFYVYREGVEEPTAYVALMAKEGAAYKLLATQEIEAEEIGSLSHVAHLSTWDAYVANN